MSNYQDFAGVFLSIMSSVVAFIETKNTKIADLNASLEDVTTRLEISLQERLQLLEQISSLSSSNAESQQQIEDLSIERQQLIQEKEAISSEYLAYKQEDELQDGSLLQAIENAKVALQALGVIETPVDETPVDETPVDETPVDETPVDETPVDETPVDETPVDENPAP